jgi:hypothetical protein
MFIHQETKNLASKESLGKKESLCDEKASPRAATVALALLVCTHIFCTFVLIPPRELINTDPIPSVDHPFHAYDLMVYRAALSESGVPWGYDPAVGAGKVLRPSQDAGGRPQELIGALLPFAPPGSIIRWFLFVSVLTFPIWTWLSARRLGFSRTASSWSLFLLIAIFWLYGNLSLSYRFGQVAFPDAALLSPYVLVLFLNALQRPNIRAFLGTLAGLNAVFLLHVLGPVVIAPSLLIATIVARPLSWRWRAAALAAPFIVIAINAFWFVPFVLGLRMPNPPNRPFDWNPPDLRYMSIDHLLASLSPSRVAVALCGSVLALYGLVLLKRISGIRASWCLGLAIFFGLSLKFLGSFIPGIALMQPIRFFLPAVALMVLPAGLVLEQIVRRIRLPTPLAMCGLAAVAVALALFMPRRSGSFAETTYAGGTTLSGGSFALELPRSVIFLDIVPPLRSFIEERTSPQDRLLVQTINSSEPLVIPMLTKREVVGNTYQDEHDPAQFLLHKLFGKRIIDWETEELRSTLERWGIVWAFAHTQQAIELFERLTNDSGEQVGVFFRAFRVQRSSSRFLRGQGEVSGSVNRLDLTGVKSDNGIVVLRYRYHPALETTSGDTVYPYVIPEDPGGFILLKNPREQVTLRFNPWKMLFARWP